MQKYCHDILLVSLFIPDMLDSHEDDEERPQKKRRKLSNIQENNNNNNNNNQDMSFIKVFKCFTMDEQRTDVLSHRE